MPSVVASGNGVLQTSAKVNPGESPLQVAQIRAVDESIDRLVYELYGLSPAEIAIVEGA